MFSVADKLSKCTDPALCPPLPSHDYTRQQVHSVPLRSDGTGVCWLVYRSINQSPIYSFNTVWSIVYSGLCPLLIFVLWAAMFRPGSHKVHVTILGFLVTLILTSFLTDVIKNVVGRPRPDFISRCMPQRGTPGDILVAWTVCTQTNDHILQDGWRSFPSGHSSFSFAGLGYLA